MSVPDAITTEQGGTTAAQIDGSLSAAPLPIQRGDLPAASETPQHEWPGSLFYGLSYVTSVGLGAGACGSVIGAVVGVGGPRLGLLGLAVLLAAGSAVQWKLASEVSRFTKWGWYGAMVELGLATAAKLWTMATTGQFGALFGVAIDVAWMRYFWTRREQFDVDLDL